MQREYAAWACRSADLLSKATSSTRSSRTPKVSVMQRRASWEVSEPEERICYISKGNDNMSKAFSPLLLKVFSPLPQNYAHLTLLKSALTKDEREGRPKALHSVNPLQSTNWPESHLFWFTAASTVSVWLSSIILLNALTIRVCPEREYTLVSQL